MRLIDPPVTPYSPPEQIRDWLDYLDTLAPDTEVDAARADALRWLEGRPAFDAGPDSDRDNG